MPDTELIAVLTLVFYLAVVTWLVLRSVRDAGWDWGAWFLYAVARVYGPGMFHCRTLNPPCPIPEEGPALIVVNHRSPTDPIMVWLNHHIRRDGRPHRQMRIIGFLTAAEYCNLPGIGWICRKMHSIPVQRNGQDMGPTREALRRLKSGQVVGIFPEGRINPARDLTEGNQGVAFLALKSQVPVYPVFIEGAPRPSVSMVTPFIKRCRVTVKYGESVDLSSYYGRKLSPGILAEVTDLLMSRLAETGGVGFTAVEQRTEE